MKCRFLALESVFILWEAQSVFSASCFHAALGNQTGTEYISIVNVISY